MNKFTRGEKKKTNGKHKTDALTSNEGNANLKTFHSQHYRQKGLRQQNQVSARCGGTAPKRHPQDPWAPVGPACAQPVVRDPTNSRCAQGDLEVVRNVHCNDVYSCEKLETT